VTQKNQPPANPVRFNIRAISACGRDEVAALFARDEPSLVILDLPLA